MKILFLLHNVEAAYVGRVKAMFGTAVVKATTAVPGNRFELQAMMDKNEFDAAVVSNWEAASAIIGTKIKAPGEQGQGKTLFDYQGSCLVTSKGKRILIINALQTLVTIPYQKFVTERFISKVTQPEKWHPQTPFIWEQIKDHQGFERALEYLESSVAVAIDIETGANHRITEIGFCGIKEFKDSYETCSFVIDLTSMEAVHWMRKLCMTKPPKVFHNGVYDTTHLLSWNTPVWNWLFDTLGFMHSTYVELPRDLAFTAAMYVRDVEFWKDENASGNKEDQLRYNARDVWATANVLVNWLATAPEYAKRNYALKAPELSIAVLCGLEGLQVDLHKRAALRLEQQNVLDTQKASIEKMTWKGFNPNSPQHMKLLFSAFGATGATSTDAKAREKLSEKNPIAARILAAINEWKKAAKLVSTYLEAPVYGSTMLYSFNPFGTESCRWSSAKSHLFQMEGAKYIHYGAQCQNMAPYAKKMLRASEGWWIMEVDKSASESYCTALLSGSDELWDAVHNAPDFHCWNASLFFGIPFDKLYDASTDTVLQPAIRKLAKPVNHGANYCMGPTVLVETIGERKVFEAKELLMDSYKTHGNTAGLSAILGCVSAKEIAAYLLQCFHAAYPTLSGRWYPAVKREIAVTGVLASPSGWTRRFFGDVVKNKLDANSAIAFGPQHLSVMMLNRGLRHIFDDLVGENFRLHAQVHDSVLFSVRVGHEHLAHEVDKRLQTPLTYKGRTLVIPNDVDPPKIYWK